MDEVTLTGTTEIVELKNGKINEYKIGPEDFGLKAVKFSDISGGNLESNKKIALDILEGRRDDSLSNLISFRFSPFWSLLISERRSP